jgi:hypothetical protein
LRTGELAARCATPGARSKRVYGQDLRWHCASGLKVPLAGRKVEPLLVQATCGAQKLGCVL